MSRDYVSERYTDPEYRQSPVLGIALAILGLLVLARLGRRL